MSGKIVFAAFVFLLVIAVFPAFASAEFSLAADKGIYNFGDEIVVSYEFSRDQDFSGLVKLSLACESFGLDFYTSPTNIFAGEKQSVSVPQLSVSPAMVGRCFVSANVTSYDGSVNENSSSGFFNVTNRLSVDVDIGKEDFLPAEVVEVSGVIGKSHTLPAMVTMSFLRVDYPAVAADNSFAYSIRLPHAIKSGKHSIGFVVNDSYGNSGSASAGFSVEPVPTKAVNTVESSSVRPSEAFGIVVTLFDQAGDRIRADTHVTVLDSSGVVVATASGETGSNITLSFPAYQKPGAYTIRSAAAGLSASTPVAVEDVEEVMVVFDNSTALLKNTGNVEYARKFNVTLSGRKSYVIVHDVFLEPGEVFEVDLTNKVSEGAYNISFPTVPNSSGFEDVFVEDQRSIVKKLSDLTGITSHAVKVTSTGTGRIQAALAPVLLLAIVGIVGFYFARNRRKRTGGSLRRGSGKSDGIGLSGDGDSAFRQPSPPVQAGDDERVMRIIEEKRRQQILRQPEKPKDLRNDPQAQKFLRDVMKEKQFR
ncbi:TPA: hypothetical protein HA231_02145 [Candidatus Woesearchaeota archaeon]|nr:hypothetical protein [Candidatus Woesearchaeota archaeon]